jgi:hypothetical protein
MFYTVLHQTFRTVGAEGWTVEMDASWDRLRERAARAARDEA